jgi:formylmethanofuran dehydrogenase subunit B
MDLHQQVVCPGCGCVCDDLRLHVSQGQLKAIEPFCRKAEDWFRRHWDACHCWHAVDGQVAELDSAIDRAADILNAAEYPLLYGLSRADTSGQRQAVALAEHLGGVVDSTASLCHGPSIMALQEFGEVTCTLGEVKNRADLVVFWGCDPATSHPRHAERYSVFPTGKLIPAGREDRVVAFVGDADLISTWKLNDSGDLSDHSFPIQPGRDFEALNCLRAMLRDEWQGTPIPGMEQLLRLMKACKYGIVFFGLGLAKTSMWGREKASQSGHNDVAALLSLVAELNAFTRFTARRMRLQGDVSGADNVMLWQTGYPFGVDFSRGYPRYNPGEYTCNDLLSRKDVDACLLLGAETIQYLSVEALQYLETIPTILIDHPGAESEWAASVQISTAVHGIHAPGTIYRMDNIPLTLKALTESDLPTDADVLQAIMQRCDGLAGEQRP